MTDEDGYIVWLAMIEPFGKTAVHPVSEIENNFRFPGQYYDAETGLHYNYHRYYNPDTGRYLTPDPIGLTGGLNLYTYTNNNPIRFVDPFGLFKWGKFFQAAGSGALYGAYYGGIAGAVAGSMSGGIGTGPGFVAGAVGAAVAGAVTGGVLNIYDQLINDDRDSDGVPNDEDWFPDIYTSETDDYNRNGVPDDWEMRDDLCK